MKSMILNRIQWPLKILKILNIIVETTQFAMNGIITTARRRYQLLKTLNIGKIHYIDKADESETLNKLENIN